MKTQNRRGTGLLRGPFRTIEQDFENRTHIAVIVEEDPGKDLDLMRQPGHRFFFSEDELELIV